MFLPVHLRIPDPNRERCKTASGTNSPFAALHKSGSDRGFICRAFAISRPVSFDPYLPSVTFDDCDAASNHALGIAN